MYQVTFFPNGVSMVFKDGEQVNELQVPWMRLFLAHLEALGIDPRGVRFTMPNGLWAKVFVTEHGEFNWTLGEV